MRRDSPVRAEAKTQAACIDPPPLPPPNDRYPTFNPAGRVARELLCGTCGIDESDTYVRAWSKVRKVSLSRRGLAGESSLSQGWTWDVRHKIECYLGTFYICMSRSIGYELALNRSNPRREACSAARSYTVSHPSTHAYRRREKKNKKTMHGRAGRSLDFFFY